MTIVTALIDLINLIMFFVRLGWHHPAMHLIASSIPESCMLILLGTHIGGILM